MTKSDTEIVVEDPTAPAEDSPPIASTRTVDTVVMILLLALAGLMAFDNWRTGISWDASGPQAGYFPFYLSLILAAASLWGLAKGFIERSDRVFVQRDQFKRVLQIFVPTLLYVVVMQWLGLYVASFILIVGFMGLIGRIAWWKSVLTAVIFTVAMFITFEIAFDVIMPKGPLEALLGY
jgi:putative tricarboxylic transport membrane protein